MASRNSGMLPMEPREKDAYWGKAEHHSHYDDRVAPPYSS